MAENHKIVYAFVAFNDTDLLERKIKFLYTAEDYFIVHWNKYSSRRKMRQLQEAFKDYPNVHIYSKIKVAWGAYTILLAMLENMRLALGQAGTFDHLIMLSEQCIPIKTKEYIKAHLAQFKGRSFLGSCHIISQITSYAIPYETQATLLTGYFFGIPCRRRLPFAMRWQMYFYAVLDFFYYLMPILKNARQTLRKMARAKSFPALQPHAGIRKIVLWVKYIFLFPIRFAIFSLMRSGSLGIYGQVSKLYDYCTSGTFQKTKSPGPAACYCCEDVEFLCRPENIKLAKSMKRYHSCEEYFCQTLLYNSETQRKNFLDENLCATDYGMRGLKDVLRYLDPRADLARYQFHHVCFLRKVADPEIYHIVEERLLKQPH